jgi:DNA polymerase III epsilon subunit-like protein
MLILFFDTETTGFIDKSAGPDSPTQPHMVQLGAVLADMAGKEAAEPLSVIIRPDGWTIPREAARVHGITTDIALKQGRRLDAVLKQFDGLAARAQMFVAHNFDFDSLVMRAAYIRAGMAQPFTGKDSYCTMKQATDVCRLPGRYGYKWPALTEAHTHFFGEGFTEAHNALADVRACKRVFFALRGTNPT